LSFGAPLLDGWIAPAEAFAARDRFRLVQVESVLSRTAAMADQCLTEGDAAKLARQLAGPVLAIDREMSPAIVALNQELGGWGKTILPRPDAPGRPVDTVEDGSIRVLYIDESNPGEYIPWPVIESKLAKDAVVIAFTWSREGYARHAQYVLPTAVFPEALDDLPNGRAATPLVKTPEWVADPVEFIAKANLAESLKAREGAEWPAGFQQVDVGRAWAYPMSSKLSQESNLVLAPGQVAMHPSSGPAKGSRAFLQTRRGKVPVQVVHDPGVPAGKLEYVRTPEVLDLCCGEEPKVVRA